MIEENIDKNLQIELVTKYGTNDAWKESLVEGSKSAVTLGKESLMDLDILVFWKLIPGRFF